MAKRIFIAGHNGMVGRAISRTLQLGPECELICKGHADLDLTSQSAVQQFFKQQRIDQVYLAAAKVGGIHANNTYPAEFIYQNLMMTANIIEAAHRADVQDLLFLGSSCIYPKLAAQPISEDALLTGQLEATNEPYAIAKIAGIKLCESYNRQYGRDYRCVMPTNLYGPHDNFHAENSHVIPALIKKFHKAATDGDDVVSIWGTGTPRREFLHVDDMAAASVFAMNLPRAELEQQTSPMNSHLNVGTGKDHTIRELAELIAELTGFTGRLEFDETKPDGTPQKLLQTSKLAKLGWRFEISLRQGLRDTIDWYRGNIDQVRG
ncbi:MAG: GDP-L-fucose synthase [Alphaproteobacteria bacterium]|nr:GDP-L-fucose synthase [Alphaproteobacteria bacterium]